MAVQALFVMLIIQCFLDRVWLAPIPKKHKTKTILKTPKVENNEHYEVIGVDDLEKMELRVCGIDSYEDARYGCVQLKDSEDWLSDENMASIPERGNILEPKDKLQHQFLKESDYGSGYSDIIDLDTENIPELEDNPSSDQNPNNSNAIVLLDGEISHEPENIPETELMPEQVHSLESEEEPKSANPPESEVAAALDNISETENAQEPKEEPTPENPVNTENPLQPENISGPEKAPKSDSVPEPEETPAPEKLPKPKDALEIEDTQESKIAPKPEIASETESQLEPQTELEPEIELETVPKLESISETQQTTTTKPESTTQQKPETATGSDGLEIIDSLEYSSELDDLSTLENEPGQVVNEVESRAEVKTDTFTTTTEREPKTETTPNEDPETETTYVAIEKSIEIPKDEAKESDESAGVKIDLLNTTTESIPGLESTMPDNITDSLEELSELEDLPTFNNEAIPDQVENGLGTEVSTDPLTTRSETVSEPETTPSGDGDKETTNVTGEESIGDYTDKVDDPDESDKITTDLLSTTKATTTEHDITLSENENEETTSITEETGIEEFADIEEIDIPAEVNTGTQTTANETEAYSTPSKDTDKATTKLPQESSIEEYKETVGKVEVSTDVSADQLSTFESTKSTPIIWSNEPPSKQVLPPELLKCEHNAKCRIIEFN